jgi:hypothetical protein
MAERKAVTKQMARRYRKASKAEKTRMLDELSALTGCTRRHARRALGAALHPAPRPGPVRPRTYGGDVLEPLVRIWAVLGGPAGKRLVPFMGEMFGAYFTDVASALATADPAYHFIRDNIRAGSAGSPWWQRP